MRRLALAMGGVSLLCQVLAWAFLIPAAVTATGLTLQICTPQGFVTVTLPVDGASDDTTVAFASSDGTAPDGKATNGQDAPMMGDHCPICGLVAGLVLPPPAIAAPLPQNLAAHGTLGLPGQHIAAGWFLSRLKARAPPTLI